MVARAASMVAAVAAMLAAAGGVVLAPPWADVRRNPCAAHPRGWLMLYWPPDAKCYTIYKKGYPCPESMELSPGRSSGAGRAVPECRCPPGYGQLPMSTACHKLFERGPCSSGEYFAPVEETFNKKGERAGMCMRPTRCGDETQVFWPQDGRCYRRYSQGPCYPGTILDLDTHGIAHCTCDAVGANSWNGGSTAGDGGGGGCYEHYSRGPCERGQLFLPGGACGCRPHMPHYHNGTGGCYQIDTSGPCPRGHTFSVTAMSEEGAPRAACTCKPFHVRPSAGAGVESDGACYRLYTRGPCAPDEMIVRGGRCARIPCARGRLYYPERRKCYRPGSPEPCPRGQVLTFDFEARPSVDGVSHNGKCACAGEGVGGACGGDGGGGGGDARETCSSRAGMVTAAGACHMLRTRGPCAEGAWLVAGAEGASCVCRPGREGPACAPAAVRLADYLNTSVKPPPPPPPTVPAAFAK